MILRGFLIILFIIISINYSFSQQEDYLHCKTTEMNKIQEKLYPEYAKDREELEKFTEKYIQNPDKVDEVYVIPIVFHIVHDYGSENISKEQVLDAVRIINEDFRKLNTDTNIIVSAFKTISADSYIEFRLANKDPNGNCTEGITRTQSPLTVNASDNVKYIATAWPRDKYLNVWVVRSVEGAAGYAYYPSTWTSASVDGIILNNTYIGSIGTGSYTRSRALTHEIGHYLNLAHPWGNSNEPGLSTNCNEDDGVSDTPNTIGWTTCNLNGTSCGSLDNVQNFMEYSYCSRMFTFGQKNRMRAALNSSTASRNNLWKTSNLIATGTNDGYVASTCAPIVDFGTVYPNVCTGYSVQYLDLSYNASVDQSWNWNWSFPGGTPSTSTLQNPIVVYNNSGTYNATLSITNSGGNNQKTKSSILSVVNPIAGEIAPFSYGFENSTFPNNTTDANKSWSIDANGDYTWERNSSASSTGNASVRIRNYGNDAGTINGLISPNIVMGENTISGTLSFKIAYAKRNADSYENLKVYVSANCGRTWSMRYSRSGNTLVTNGGNYVSTTFVPNSTQWREDVVNLGTYGDSANIRLKFEINSNGGNYLYLDDINISIVTSDQIISELEPYINIFPNPVDYSSSVVYTLYKNSDVKFEIYELSGRKINEISKKQVAGNYTVAISEYLDNLSGGIYIFKATIGEYTKAFRLVKD